MNGSYARSTATPSARKAPAGASPRREGLGRWERAALAAIVMLLILGACLTAGQPVARVKTGRVVAGPGDTLWTLAVAHPTDGLTTQQNADLIAHLNGLDGRPVPAGRSLAVPMPSGATALAMR